MKVIKGYRFVNGNLKSKHGKVKWELGKWNKLDNGEPLQLCQNGFHASQRPTDSLNYIFGTRWFECEARGEILKDIDKFCATEMRLVREIPTKVIRQFAIDCAWRVLHIFEEKYPDDKRPRKALEAAQVYLNNPTKVNKDKLDAAGDARAARAAWDAAWAARDAAWAARDARAARAAWDAAWAAGAAWDARAAARDAAGTAAWAAGDAARDAGDAGDAEIKWQNKHLINLIRKQAK